MHYLFFKHQVKQIRYDNICPYQTVIMERILLNSLHYALLLVIQAKATQCLLFEMLRNKMTSEACNVAFLDETPILIGAVKSHKYL